MGRLVRMSVLRDDPGFSYRCKEARVWLDGVEVTHECQTADDERGEVLLLLRNEEGHFYMDGESVARDWRDGRVEIQIGAVA